MEGSNVGIVGILVVNRIEHERVGMVVSTVFECAALGKGGRGGRSRIRKVLFGISSRGEIGFHERGRRSIGRVRKFLDRPFTIRTRSTTERTGRRSGDVVVVVVIEIVIVVGAHLGVFSAFVVRFLSGGKRFGGRSGWRGVFVFRVGRGVGLG